MKTRTARMSAGIALGAAFGLTGLGVAPAIAAPPTACPVMTDAVLVSEGICQLTIHTSDMTGGTAQYSMPSGITKLAAVLVGGGGSGYGGYEQSYGGGAGETIAERVPSASPASDFDLTISIGGGGVAADGGDTSISFDWNDDPIEWKARGGSSADEDLPASSGNGKTGSIEGGGGGTLGNASSVAGGSGYSSFASLVDDLDPGEPLWASLDLLSGLSGIGYGGDGEYLDDWLPYGPWLHYGPATVSPHGPGSGGHGREGWAEPVDPDGIDGFAVIRFAYSESDPADPAITLSAITAPQNGAVLVTVSGLDPHETDLTAEVNSKPFPLGAATANASGVATWTFNVPASFPTGAHTVIVTRGAHGGQQLSQPLNITGSLSNTGGELAVPGVVAGVLSVAGAALLLTAHRRRRALQH